MYSSSLFPLILHTGTQVSPKRVAYSFAPQVSWLMCPACNVICGQTHSKTTMDEIIQTVAMPTSEKARLFAVYHSRHMLSICVHKILDLGLTAKSSLVAEEWGRLGKCDQFLHPMTLILWILRTLSVFNSTYLSSIAYYSEPQWIKLLQIWHGESCSPYLFSYIKNHLFLCYIHPLMLRKCPIATGRDAPKDGDSFQKTQRL